MKLHTKLTWPQVQAALQTAKDNGTVAPDVQFAVANPESSKSHPHAYEIQLGTLRADQSTLLPGETNRRGKPQKRRLHRVTGSDAEYNYAATWNE
jgi:hypothetical protein